ncbi:hypothetical protein GF376_01930 [Candidatus Peregrinibacteria bacterium]|nr:hypothetical protein [Candidatus Peregrinibacteria bacterium]
MSSYYSEPKKQFFVYPLKYINALFQKWQLEILPIIGLYICAISTFISTSFFNIGFFIIICGLLINYRFFFRYIRFTIPLICIFCIIFIIIRTYLASFHNPSISNLMWERSFDWIRLFIFFFFALPIIKDPKRGYIVFFLALLSLIFGNLYFFYENGLIEYLRGARFGGYVGKPIANSFYSSVALTGMIVYFPELIKKNRSKPIYLSLLSLASFFCLAILISSIVLSSSRGPLVGLIIVLPPLIIYQAYKNINVIFRHLFFYIFFVLTIIGVLSIHFSSFSFPLKNRIYKTFHEVKDVYKHGTYNSSRNNVSIRIQMWQFGFQKWTEQPFIGFGPGTTEKLITQTKIQKLKHTSGKPYDHLHNYYIMNIVSFGIVGLILFSSVFFIIFINAIKLFNKNTENRNDNLFIICSFVLIILYSLTDFRHLNHDWRFFWIIISGVGYSFIFSQKKKMLL